VHVLFVVQAVASHQRPTGRQQFLADASLSLSDVAFVGSDGGAADSEAVEIDESLFDDVDDLQLDDDEADD